MSELGFMDDPSIKKMHPGEVLELLQDVWFDEAGCYAAVAGNDRLRKHHLERCDTIMDAYLALRQQLGMVALGAEAVD